MFHFLTRRAASWAKPVGHCRPPRRSPRLVLEELECRLQPSTLTTLTADSIPAGLPPTVTVKDAATGAVVFTLQPYAAAFTGGVHVAVGNGLIVTGPGAGGGPDVKAFDSSGNLMFAVKPYAPAFLGGVAVAVGDLNHDGVADVITAPGTGGGADIKIINGRTGALERSFFAFDPLFTGGATVGTGDINGDGADDIITGAGPGGGPTVRAWNGMTGAMLANFAAFDPNFTGGVTVATQDINLDGRADIMVGTGPLVPAQVGVFDGKDVSHILSRFFPFGNNYFGGAGFAVGNISDTGQVTIRVVRGSATNGPAGSTGEFAQQLDSSFIFNPTFGDFTEAGV